MKSLRWIQFAFIMLLVSACTSNGSGISGIFETPTALPSPQVGITPAPDAQAAVKTFLEALQKDDFEVMYNLLSQSSREGITLEDFSKRWSDTLNEMSASSIEFIVSSSTVSPRNAEVGYSITYKTVLAGDLRRLCEEGVSGGCITLHDALNGGRYQQIPAYDALDLPLVKDLLGSREPAGSGGDSAAQLQSHCEPARASRGGWAPR